MSLFLQKEETKETFILLYVIILEDVDVIVTSECIQLYFLCIVPGCLFQDVSVMYLSHVMPRCSHREIQ